jgi:hypothetical protein
MAGYRKPPNQREEGGKMSFHEVVRIGLELAGFFAVIAAGFLALCVIAGAVSDRRVARMVERERKAMVAHLRQDYKGEYNGN